MRRAQGICPLPLPSLSGYEIDRQEAGTHILAPICPGILNSSLHVMVSVWVCKLIPKHSTFFSETGYI